MLQPSLQVAIRAKSLNLVWLTGARADRAGPTPMFAQSNMRPGRGPISPYNLKQRVHVISYNGVPQNGWFIMGNTTKMDDLGVPAFLETFILSAWIIMTSMYLNVNVTGMMVSQGNHPQTASFQLFFRLVKSSISARYCSVVQKSAWNVAGCWDAYTTIL